MIHIIIFDDVHLTDIKNLPDYNTNKLYGVEVSVNAHSDVLDKDDRLLLRTLRFNEFCCFDKNVRTAAKECDELYLKYGGLCFLWSNDLDRYKKVEDHLKYMFKLEYKIDDLNNNGLFERTNADAAIDKLIIKKAFQEKNTEIIYYRPTEELRSKKKESIIKIMKNMSCKDIMKSKYFSYIKH